MIYADHAATTPVLHEVFEKMKPFLTELYGNPSGMYKAARDAKKAVEEARTHAAALIGSDPDEIYFTSGGTESDTWALRSGMKLSRNRNELITSTFEHHAVLYTARALEKEGFDTEYISPEENGIISPSSLENVISSKTGLVSIMYANNELGTIQPVGKLAEIAHRSGAVFHTDAVAAAGHTQINVKEEGIDLLSVSGHKFGAMKGVGFLYIRKGIPLSPLLLGGMQEHSRRAGTENVAAIAGLGEACRIARLNLRKDAEKIRHLRDCLQQSLLSLPKTYLNGSDSDRLPGTLNLSFDGIEGESLVLLMDVRGICLSTGSACTSGFTQESHVLNAIGRTGSLARGAIRITLGPENTEDEIEQLFEELKKAVMSLRSLTPGWE